MLTRLSQALAPQVSNRSRSRGHEYFVGGAVHEVTARDGAIEALVQGTEPYAVRLETSADVLFGSCTCPYFIDHFEICKHIWAVILAADEKLRPLLPPNVPPEAVQLEPMDPDAEPADAVEDGIDDDLDEWSLRGTDIQPRPLSKAERASVSARMKEYWAARRRGQASHGWAAPKPPPAPPEWQRHLDAIAGAASPSTPSRQRRLQAGQLMYVIDVAASRAAGVMVVEVMTRDRKANGEWGKPKPVTITQVDIRSLPDPDERQMLERLCGVRGHFEYGGWADAGAQLSRFRLSGVLATETVPRLCATGRCAARIEASATPQQPERPPLLPIQWDPGAPWAFLVAIHRNQSAREYTIEGWLERDGDRMEISDPLLVLADDLLLTRTHAARLNHSDAFAWLATLRRAGRMTIPMDARVALVDTLLAERPQLAEAPEELRVEPVRGLPTYRLRLRPVPGRPDRLFADLTFRYGDDIDVPSDATGVVLRSADATRAIRRDAEAEQRGVDTLHRLGCRKEWTHYHGEPVLQLATHLLPRVVRALLVEGWHVEADGRIYRTPQSRSLTVQSGIDWFELHGHVDYGEQQASLPALLAALERGESFVTLGDGSVGLLPEEWLRKQLRIATLGTPEDNHIRFQRSQTALLDALLAAQPEVTYDAAFDRARSQLKTFEGLRALDPPATFVGTLREYQRDGLGWFAFLQQFGFGGCLADDMGLGKTVMVLALLEGRRNAQPASDRRPSLAVVPRSLVFNWHAEASRFTPGLRVLEYSGTGRAQLASKFDDVDLVVTTYGTLRRDAARLTTHAFDYVVLDESQAIKNAQTASAKACRLLNARHRLALSGTPIENHLGELGSLFEFLNPGLLGRRAFTRLTGPGTLEDEQITMLARGLRPFILRRTKEQVARELPPKTEQTIYCELERPQRVLYDELRDHYRRALLDRIRENGVGRAKIQILEALLRLRQAACHPALIDRGRSTDSSAKLDVLLPRVREAVDEGHKTLVFSQFTSLLAIVRAQLDADGVRYEYLDGRTRDRAERVSRFQSDAECRLFLISLKAGGLGLNLTATEYVFLLDPWWNPAVEAQAIDRAHRIGQARHVFAYRLIARDTVEERVLELQQRKRRLADAILMADNAMLRDLTREDLELLLS